MCSIDFSEMSSKRMMAYVGGRDIIEISSKQETAERDPIFGRIWTANNVQCDLLLLENQIPFFVLEKLFRRTVEQIPERPNKCSLSDIIFKYFSNVTSAEGDSTNNGSSTATRGYIFPINDDYYHILHKLHGDQTKEEQSLESLPSAYLEHAGDQTKQKQCLELLPSASNLDFAGVKFVACKRKDLFNQVVFDTEHTVPKWWWCGKDPFWWCRRARFYIPTLDISDNTESFLRNLIAFEQCCPGISNHFTSYASLMDMLINTEKDVQVLVKAGVIRNYLGTDADASDLFNRLCKEVVLGRFLFAETCKKVCKYSERSWPKDMAYVRRRYFASPWTFIAFCLAFIAFGMSVTSFIYGFLD